MGSNLVLNPVAVNFLSADVVIERICRTCLLEKENMHPLFENNADETLMACTSIQLSKDDGLPSKICSGCLLKAQQAFVFKQQAENAEIVLKQHFGLDQEEEKLLQAIKVEITELDTEYNPITINSELMLEDVKDEIKVKQNVSDSNLIQENKTEIQPNISFQCTKCLKYFSSENELKVHNVSHITRQYTCNICNKTYEKKGLLICHIRGHELPGKKHPCTKCDKKYVYAHQLLVHMRKHTGEKPLECKIDGDEGDPQREYGYECDVCHKRYVRLCTLKRHQTIHTGETAFLCSVCGLLFRTGPLLKSHMTTHSTEKPYHCSKCPKSFSFYNSLNVHQITHTRERKHLCSFCGKGLTTASDLKRHLRIHTGERPYKCTFPNCDQRFISNNVLRKHIRKHTGEKTHCCTICQKAFNSANLLKEHMNTHTGMKPHVCSICGKRFAHSGNLFRHKKQHK